MNKPVSVEIGGFVATEPKYSVSDKGVPFITFRLASTHAHLLKSENQWVEDPTFWCTIKAWNNLATNLHNSIQKSDPIFVVGNLKLEEYETKEGENRSNIVVEAKYVGHDLNKGTASFERVKSNAVFEEESEEDAAFEEAKEVKGSKEKKKLVDA